MIYICNDCPRNKNCQNAFKLVSPHNCEHPLQSVRREEQSRFIRDLKACGITYLGGDYSVNK